MLKACFFNFTDKTSIKFGSNERVCQLLKLCLNPDSVPTATKRSNDLFNGTNFENFAQGVKNKAV